MSMFQIIDREVEVIAVVRTTLLRRGEGKEEADPVRRITQYWSVDGELLAEADPLGPIREQVDALREPGPTRAA